MERFCKLCRQLNTSSENEKTKHETEENNGNNDEMIIHVEIHRRHFRLIQGVTVSIDEMLEKCFTNEIDNDNSALANLKGGTRKSKRKKNVISIVCQELFGTTKRNHNETARCFECSTNLKIFEKGMVEPNRVVAHAAGHLGKSLFECRRCDHRCITKTALSKHLKRIHKLSIVDKRNYVDSSSEYQREIIEFMKRCFGRPREKSPSTDLRLSRYIAHKRLVSSVSAVCQKLFAKSARKQKASAHCFECDSDVKIFNKSDKCVNVSLLINHVARHLGKHMFECRHCNYRCCSRSAITAHLKRCHQLTIDSKSNYIDTSANYQDEIVDMLKRCFGSPGETSSFQPSQRQIASSGWMQLKSFCAKLLANFNRELPVVCFECGSSMRVFGSQKKGQNSTILIDHACVHLKKCLFACRHCDYQCASKKSMASHLQVRHALNSNHENYNDLSNDHRQEIIEMLKRCFTIRSETINPKGFQPKRLGCFAHNRTRLQLYCHEMLAKRDRNSLLPCYECGLKLRLFQNGKKYCGHIAIEHACTHLKKLFLYSCRHCDSRFTYKQILFRHLRKMHNLTNNAPENYVDSTNEYEKEIMDMLKRCFELRPVAAEVDVGSIVKTKIIRCPISPLANFCYLLFPKLDAGNSTTPITCLECRRSLQSFLKKEGGIRTENIIDHACMHLNKPLFSCRRCDVREITRHRIRVHVRSVHKSKSIEGNKVSYNDLSCDHLEEIKNILTLCFGKPILETS